MPKRFALVIGNGAYQNTTPLTNPKNDAEDMAAALRTLGFKVVLGLDLDKSEMDRKISDFAHSLSSAEVAVFHYSGHGLQVAGVNYLIPVDAKLASASALDFETVRLELVQRTMERQTETNILFLDACRNNPLARSLARALGTRSVEIGRGLASVDAGAGTLISFSTQPGNVASDGSGRNSPYSGPLVKAIATPGKDLLSILIEVRNEVRNATNKRQVPWEHSALLAPFYFKPAPEPAPAPTAAVAMEEQAKEHIEKQEAAEQDKNLRSNDPNHAPRALFGAFKEWAPSATKVAAIVGAIGLLAYVVAGPLSFVAFGIVVLLLIGFLIVLVLYLPQTYEISEYLNLAERELNSLLRGWGGGLTADKRKAIARERIEMAKAVGTPEALQKAYDLNIMDLQSGGPQGSAMGRARFTAFLLREIYEGNVRNAQLKIFNEVRNGGKPYIASGVSQIVGYDIFDERRGFPEGAGVDWFPLWLTVKLHRFPRNITMVKADKTVVENWAVIEELNRQLKPRIA